MVDARDLKSRDRKIVRVRVPPSVLVKTPEQSGVLCFASASLPESKSVLGSGRGLPIADQDFLRPHSPTKTVPTALHQIQQRLFQPPLGACKGNAPNSVNTYLVMKQVFQRGVLTGAVAGLGFDLVFGWLDDWKLTFQQNLWAVLGGLAFGVILGLTMMLLLVLLRMVDRRTGWRLAPLLEQSEPGVLGLALGMVLTFPGAAVGAIAFGWGAWELLHFLYSQFPKDWNFILSALTAAIVLPPAVIAGLAAGATGGAALGSGLVGLVRGLGSRNQ